MMRLVKITSPLSVGTWVLSPFSALTTAAAVADPPVRLDRLTAALALWRGRPFCELDHPSLEPEVARLSALRAAAAAARTAPAAVAARAAVG